MGDPVSANPLGLGSGADATSPPPPSTPPAWLGLQGKANLLVEPGGFHVLDVKVLDLAEDPDPLLGPLDFQWGRREGWGGKGEGQGPLGGTFWGQQAHPCSGGVVGATRHCKEAGTSPSIFEVGNKTHAWLPRLVGGALEAVCIGTGLSKVGRGACLPPILPSSVRMASRTGGRQREWSADVGPSQGYAWGGHVPGKGWWNSRTAQGTGGSAG